MDVDIKPGTYVVAVSGGVDSVVLLDLLAQKPGLNLVVAHYDHGIRGDSEKDRLFVQTLAKKYGLPFVFAEGKLGAKASEETARTARYEFLEKTKKAAGADAIVTAHHEDDVLETAIINILRGTGRRGLTALKSGKIIRQLLGVPKKDILAYAKQRKLKWREDPTNIETDYLRNWVRHKIVAKFGPKERRQMLGIIAKLKVTNKDTDAVIADVLKAKAQKDELDRHFFIMLSHDTAKELMAGWLRQNGITSYDKQTLERLVRAAKTYLPGKQVDIIGKVIMLVNEDTLALARVEC